MAGAYTHLTVAHVLSGADWTSKMLSTDGKYILGSLFKYCELGAVSPDYPYLTATDAAQGRWADLMHFGRAGEILKSGIRRLRALEAGEDRDRGFAWLLGYAAHFGTDLTIHPVVNRKVGPYPQNKPRHRFCEMNQDVFLYPRLNLGGVQISKHLKYGVATCSAKENPDQLDPAITRLWHGMLSDVHGDEMQALPPEFNRWHSWFRYAIEKWAASDDWLVGLARHIPFTKTYVYPKTSDMEFVEKLPSPEGYMHLDGLFARTCTNVAGLWHLIDAAVLGGDDGFESAIGSNWDMDTGEIERMTGKAVFWQTHEPLVSWQLEGMK